MILVSLSALLGSRKSVSVSLTVWKMYHTVFIKPVSETDFFTGHIWLKVWQYWKGLKNVFV